MTITPSRAKARAGSPREMWIHARAIVNAGWVPRPRRALGGRHASPETNRGRNVLARAHGIRPAHVRHMLASIRHGKPVGVFA